MLFFDVLAWENRQTGQISTKNLHRVWKGHIFSVLKARYSTVPTFCKIRLFLVKLCLSVEVFKFSKGFTVWKDAFFSQIFHFSSPHSSASRCARSTMRVWKMSSVLRGIQKNAKRVIMMPRTYQNFDSKMAKNRKISIFLKNFFKPIGIFCHKRL